MKMSEMFVKVLKMFLFNLAHEILHSVTKSKHCCVLISVSMVYAWNSCGHDPLFVANNGLHFMTLAFLRKPG